MENTENKKIAVVTGASRGIGRACAIELGKAGYTVVVNYSSNSAAADEVVQIIKDAGSDAMAIKANVADQKEVQDMMRTVTKTYGQIDVLVNNAGICIDEYLLMIKKETLDKVLDLNIKGYMYCAQAAALKMYSKKSGCIINMSSVSSKMALAGQAVYSATKGAVNSMTQVMAKELAPRGVRVNAIAPGFIDTEMIQQIPEETREQYLKEIPMGRFADPAEVGRLVVALASDACSYMTGQTLVLDGGLSL